MKSNALLISHDIGGFRLAYHFLKKTYLEPLFLCQGPAKFELDKLGGSNINHELSDLELDNYDIYITTGWQTTFEKSYMQQLLPKYRDQIYVCLDHWVNYQERIMHNGSQLPIKNFCVFDMEAKLLCEKIWPNANMFLLENYFDLSFLKRLQSEKSIGSHDLFLSDPISEQYQDKLGYDEFDQLNFIYEKRKRIYSEAKGLIVRAHPSESSTKYVKYIERKNFEYVSVSNASLEKDFAKSANIFGASSYAMHLAILAGKNVFCSIPLSGHTSSLPHRDIRYLVNE